MLPDLDGPGGSLTNGTEQCLNKVLGTAATPVPPYPRPWFPLLSKAMLSKAKLSKATLSYATLS